MIRGGQTFTSPAYDLVEAIFLIAVEFLIVVVFLVVAVAIGNHISKNLCRILRESKNA